MVLDWQRLHIPFWSWHLMIPKQWRAEGSAGTSWKCCPSLTGQLKQWGLPLSSSWRDWIVCSIKFTRCLLWGKCVCQKTMGSVSEFASHEGRVLFLLLWWLWLWLLLLWLIMFATLNSYSKYLKIYFFYWHMALWSYWETMVAEMHLLWRVTRIWYRYFFCFGKF